VLDEAVDEDELRRVALAVKAEDSATYERTFILHFTPEMPRSEGVAWATSHFDPTLEIHVNGLTPSEQAELEQLPDEDGREIVGTWMDPVTSARIQIYEAGGTRHLEFRFADGSSYVEELRPSSKAKGAWEDVEGSAAGDYYLVNADGHLELHDDMGLISTKRPAD